MNLWTEDVPMETSSEASGLSISKAVSMNIEPDRIIIGPVWLQSRFPPNLGQVG